MDFIWWMYNTLLKTSFEKFVIHSWAVWSERQAFIHDNESKTIAMNIGWSALLLEDFQVVSKLGEQSAQRLHPESERFWKPPRRSGLKLNVDACVNLAANRFSVGGVVRDILGRLLLTFEKQISQPISLVHG